MDQTNLQQRGISGVEGGGQVTIYQYFLASPYFAGFGNFENIERKMFLSTFDQLSMPLRDFLSSDETVYKITALSQNYNLEDDQVAELASTIRELVVGKVFIKDFPTLISSKLGIDNTKAEEMANKLISKSFGPIIEDVKRIQRSKFPEKIQQLQKEGRPEGLTRGEAPRLPAQPPKPPMTDIRPGPAPTPQPQQRPEFKIPDLAPKIEVKPQSSTGAQKSLEEELEKVASVIDLRDKSK